MNSTVTGTSQAQAVTLDFGRGKSHMAYEIPRFPRSLALACSGRAVSIFNGIVPAEGPLTCAACAAKFIWLGTTYTKA